MDHNLWYNMEAPGNIPSVSFRVKFRVKGQFQGQFQGEVQFLGKTHCLNLPAEIYFMLNLFFYILVLGMLRFLSLVYVRVRSRVTFRITLRIRVGGHLG